MLSEVIYKPIIKGCIIKEMYPLLPLQVFKLRYKMEQIKKKYGEGSIELKETIMEAKKYQKQYQKREVNYLIMEK